MSVEAATTSPATVDERRIRVIWNTSAGQKGAISTNATTEETMRELLQRFRLGDELHATDGPDEARELARQAVRDGYDVVVAAGGDGTIALVATELLGTPVALGILPLGSVMNVPRMLGLPRELEEAARIVATGIVRAMDVGEANGSPFYETASVGMNAAMFREAHQFEKGDYGSPLRVLWVAFRYRPARMRLALDGEPLRTRALMITISNGPYTGVGMTVAPDARLDDGRFDVRVFRRFSKVELLRHLGSIAFGRRSYSPHVSTHRAQTVRVDSARPLPCRADSHDLGTTPLECRVSAGALRVLVAPDAPADGGNMKDEPTPSAGEAAFVPSARSRGSMPPGTLPTTRLQARRRPRGRRWVTDRRILRRLRLRPTAA